MIEPMRDQPRKNFDEIALQSLSESIKQYGVIVPITVRRITDGRYRIIAGERRYRAARMAGLQKVPVHIVEADELSSMEMALVENIQRSDLNPVEQAEGIKTLIDRYGMHQDDAAESIGISRPAITNFLRLLDLPDEVRELLIQGKITAGHGKALAGLEDPKLCISAAQNVISASLSVRQTEVLVKKLKASPRKAKKENDGIDYAGELARELTEKFGREVKIKMHGKKAGVISLAFSDAEDLDSIIENFK